MLQFLDRASLLQSPISVQWFNLDHLTHLHRRHHAGAGQQIGREAGHVLDAQRLQELALLLRLGR